MGKRMSTNVEYRCQPNGGMFPIQIGGMTTELTKLSTTGQRASTASQPWTHGTTGMPGAVADLESIWIFTVVTVNRI